MVGCKIRFSDKENSSKEFEIFSLCGISLRNNKVCLCDNCSQNLKKGVTRWKLSRLYRK